MLLALLIFKKSKFYLVFCFWVSAFFGSVKVANPRSDVSLFSFGGIKNATAFGGAIAKFKDAEILEKVVQLNATYPVQPTSVQSLNCNMC